MAEPDFVTEQLKKRYFDVAVKENYPKTPEVSKELDLLESCIRMRQVTLP